MGNHIILDLGERNIKVVLIEQSEGRLKYKDCYIGRSFGIKNGTIYDAEQLKECIKKYVYEVETNSRIQTNEISFLFSMDKIVKIKHFSPNTINIEGNIMSHHIPENEFLTDEIYTQFNLDNTLDLPNPLGFSCKQMQIKKKTLVYPIHLLDFFSSIFSSSKLSKMKFSNLLETNSIICDIGYNSTRIRTPEDIVIVPMGCKHLLEVLNEKFHYSYEELEKKITISYFLNEKMSFVDECRKFFTELFEKIFKSIFAQMFHNPSLRMCGLANYIPFFCEFFSDFCQQNYRYNMLVSLARTEINIDCCFNKNAFFFCDQLKKSLL